MPRIAIIGTGMVGGALDRFFQIKGIHAGLFDPPKGHADASVLDAADIIFIAVPTPYYLDGTGFDDSFLKAALSHVPVTGKTVVLKSTILPGTTERLQSEYPMHRILINPEFLTESRVDADMQRPQRQLLGTTAQSRDMAQEVMDLLPRAPFERIMSATAAEMAKCVTNSFYALKVAYANQLFDLCQKNGVDYEDLKVCIQAEPWMGGEMHWEVIHKGYRGYGGKCLPKDVRMFVQHADAHGTDLSILKQAEAYNNDLIRSQGKDIQWEEGSPRKEGA